MTDRRRASGQQERPGEEDNPFAPPPEGEPDRPWRPRHPEPSGGAGGDAGQDEQRQRWGSQWSRRQPKRDGGAFGEPPRRDPESGGGPGAGDGPGARGRWDPADPAQRHARYAVLAGMWGVFSGLLGWEWLALLLGALALYWGVSALRGGPKPDGEPRNRRLEALEGKPPPPAAPAPPAGRPARPQLTAAISGIVLASAALVIVATTYTVQLVYKDYFDCVDEALTSPSRESCEDLLPDRLRRVLGEED